MSKLGIEVSATLEVDEELRKAGIELPEEEPLSELGEAGRHAVEFIAERCVELVDKLLAEC